MPKLTATIYLHLFKYPLKINVGNFEELRVIVEALDVTRIEKIVLEGFDKADRSENE